MAAGGWMEARRLAGTGTGARRGEAGGERAEPQLAQKGVSSLGARHTPHTPRDACIPTEELRDSNYIFHSLQKGLVKTLS